MKKIKWKTLDTEVLKEWLDTERIQLNYEELMREYEESEKEMSEQQFICHKIFKKINPDFDIETKESPQDVSIEKANLEGLPEKLQKFYKIFEDKGKLYLASKDKKIYKTYYNSLDEPIHKDEFKGFKKDIESINDNLKELFAWSEDEMVI